MAPSRRGGRSGPSGSVVPRVQAAAKRVPQALQVLQRLARVSWAPVALVPASAFSVGLDAAWSCRRIMASVASVYMTLALLRERRIFERAGVCIGLRGLRRDRLLNKQATQPKSGPRETSHALFSAGKRERPLARGKRVHKQRASVAERSNSPRASERARKQARRYSRTRALSALRHTAAMTKLTFTKDDPPPPESLPDAPRARASAAPPEAPAEEWTAEDAAFMAGWEESDASDESDGEPCPFCGGLGHSVDDCPMRRDAKGRCR